MNIGIIGCGNMGEILLDAVKSSKDLLFSKIIASDKDSKCIEHISSTYNVQITDNQELIKTSDVIIMAVKPQDIAELFEDISELDLSKKLLISIAAGVSINFLESKLNGNVSIIRAMPNVASIVKSGITALSRSDKVSDDQFKTASFVFSLVGEVVSMDEEHMDAVTAISGSGPAYVSFFIKSLLEKAINLGLDKDKSYKLVLETFIGSLKILKDKGISLSELVAKVSSPGGTTQAALSYFKDKRIDESIQEAVDAAYQRAKELSKG